MKHCVIICVRKQQTRRLSGLLKMLNKTCFEAGRNLMAGYKCPFSLEAISICWLATVEILNCCLPNGEHVKHELLHWLGSCIKLSVDVTFPFFSNDIRQSKWHFPHYSLFSPKYLLNFSALSVALMRTTFRSSRTDSRSFTIVRRTSDCRFRSWISSRTRWLMLDRCLRIGETR